MKNTLLLFIAIIATYAATAQGSLLHMSPNSGWRGQSLQPTITGSGTTFQSSTPSGPQNIYLNKQGGGTSIYGFILNLFDDAHISIYLTIPANADLGVYDLNMEVWDGFSFVPLTLTNAFLVTPSEGFLEGSVYYDLDGDGNKDVGEPPLLNSRILETPDNYTIYSDVGGSYKIGVYNGTYNLQFQPGANDIVTSVNSYSNIVINNNTSSGNDFGIQYAPTFDSLYVALSHGLLRCNTNVAFTLTTTNYCGHIMNGRVYYKKDPAMFYTSSVPVPDLISGDTLFWNISNLGILQQFTVTPSFTMPGFTGNPLLTNVVGEVYDAGSNVVFSDSSHYNEPVRCSFDPNDKQVDTPGVQAQHYTLFSDELRYTIRFQNTGNDTAFQVVLIDTLDADLDYNTFHLVNASHEVAANLNPANGVLTFSFYNILLPDSNVNESLSHGYVTYKIKTLTGLPANTEIYNTANIYFDWNPAVVTNTTMNTMVYTLPLGVNEYAWENELIIYPNPSREKFKIQLANNNSESTIKICDVTGKIIYEKNNVTNTVTEINLDTVAKGIYFLKVMSKNGIATKKIIVQ